MDDRWTLDDYLFSLFRNQKTDTSEFKVLLRVYGRERIETAWKTFTQLPKDLQKPDSKPENLDLPDVRDFREFRTYSRYHPPDD